MWKTGFAESRNSPARRMRSLLWTAVRLTERSEQLEVFAQESVIPVRVIRAPGTNMARARNSPSSRQSHPIIAVTDFGCVQEHTWLERLIQPFKIEPETRVSAGFYRSIDRMGRDHGGDGIWPGINDLNPQDFLALQPVGGFSQRCPGCSRRPPGMADSSG